MWNIQISQDLVLNFSIQIQNSSPKYFTHKPLGTWGLMYAKSIFYDSTNIFEVPSPLQSNNTWHLGANAHSSASFSRLNQSVKYFEGGFNSKKYRFINVQNKPVLGDYGSSFVSIRQWFRGKSLGLYFKSTGYFVSFIKLKTWGLKEYW